MTQNKKSLNPDEYRALQYFRQAKICTFLDSNNPVVPCLRYMQFGKDEVDLVLNGAGKARYRNLQTCNRVWLCPICAGKVSRKRRQQLTRAVDAMEKSGAVLAFVTYTIQHSAADSFETVRQRVQDAHRELHSHRQWKLIQERYAWLGAIRSIEITYTEHGWHFHIHEIGFLGKDYNRAALERTLSDRWDAQVTRVGGAQLDGIGLKVKRADRDVRTYISKWGIVKELLSFSGKGARGGGIWPFQFADICLRDKSRETWARDKFSEYADGIHGTKQIYSSKLVREIVKDVSPGLETQDRYYPAVASLTPDQWRIISTTGNRVNCLRAIENDELKTFLERFDF